LPIFYGIQVSVPCSKQPSTVPVLSQISPFDTTNHISLRSILILSQWSLSFWFSHQNPICMPLSPMHATYLAHIILFDLFILWRVQWSSSLCSFLQLYVILSHICPNILLSTLFLNTPVCLLPLMSEIKFHAHTKLQAKLLFCIFYICGQQMKRQKVLNWMVGRITQYLNNLEFHVNQTLICYCHSQKFELCHIFKRSIINPAYPAFWWWVIKTYLIFLWLLLD
jgi:hypothetical protein